MPSSRQLALSQRDNFFSDPFFADILSIQDQGLRGRLDLFKNNQVAVAGGSDQAHNLQVTASNDKFMIQLELPGFAPEEFSLKTRDEVIVLEAKHQGKADGGEEVTERSYRKEFKMPSGVNPEQLTSSYSASGILTIQAPRKLTAPEGAEVAEAMAAKSKAYASEDGKTKVKEQAQSSSQMIAATTESPDGSTKSSMSFSSSNSSSSSTVTSSDGGPMMATGMGMPQMPQMQMPAMPGMLSMDPGADMDAMMKKMMGGMSLGGQSGAASSNFSSSSSSSFSSSSTSSSTMQQKGSSSLMGGMKPFPGMGMNALDIEELSTAGSDVAQQQPPSYTVTSPPASVAGDDAGGFPASTSHSVKPAADYKKVEDPQADCTVLLKLREGSEYKLVLNMQQYKPEHISVKLSEDENELTVTAAAADGGQEDFVQRHRIPAGIDVDKLESSFSADGVLVIKAPKKK